MSAPAAGPFGPVQRIAAGVLKVGYVDATREWPEKLSPFVTVGRVRIPRQDITGSLDSDAADALAFNQWRVTADHRPMGEIMDVRRVYTTSAKVRRTLNHQPQREPASADEVLAWPPA